MKKEDNKIIIKNSRFFLKNLRLFLIPVLLPVLILGSFSIIITQQYLKEYLDMYNDNLLEQVRFQVDMIFQEIESTYNGILDIPEVNNNLRRILKMGSFSLDDYKLLRYINNNLSAQVKSREYLKSIYIYYNNSEKKFLSSSSGIIFDQDYYDLDWQKEFEENRMERDRWISYRRTSPDSGKNRAEDLITIYWNIYYEGRSEGVIVINIYADYIEKLLAKLDTLEDQVIVVLEADNNILFSNKRLSYLGELDLLYQLGNDDNDLIKTELKSDLFPWTYCSLVSAEVIYQVPERIKKILFLLILSLFLSGLFISYYLTKRNYQRVLNIIEIINSAEGNRELPKIKEKEDDEYTYITNKIIKTFLQNNYLKLQVSEKIYRQRTLELLALQSQINPHFLYNTLETIYWKVFQFTKSPNQANKMLEYLSDILKYSLHSPGEKVKIIEEINNTKSYLEIQQIRYKNRFKVYWQYSDSVINKKISKLILQPIVENAIYYGINELGKPGKIKIKILEAKDSNTIRIAIIDNGKGIEEKKLREIKTVLEKGETDNQWIGLLNTNKRLILMYGEESQTQIRSKLGLGTVVYFKIPIED